MSCLQVDDTWGLLTKAWQDRNLDNFEGLINTVVIDPYDADSTRKLNNLLFTIAQELTDTDDGYKWLSVALSGDSSRANAQQYGMFLIHRVVKKNNLGALNALRDAGVDVNARAIDKSTALHIAVENGNDGFDCLQTLLRDDVILVDLEDMTKCTPIMYAVDQGNIEAIKLILKKGRVNIDRKMKDSDMTIRDYVKKKFPEIALDVEPLKVEDFANCAHLFEKLENIKEAKDPIKIVALENDFCDTLQHIKEDIIKAHDGQSNLAEAAVKAKSKRALEAIIKKKITDEMWDSALCVAASYDYDELVEHLLNSRHGEKDIGHSALIAAARRLSFRSLQILANSVSRKIINKPDKDGNTALHYVVYQGNSECALELLRKGAYLASSNDLGKNPLDYIETDTLRQFLDEQMSNLEKENELQFNYEFLNYQDCNDDQPRQFLEERSLTGKSQQKWRKETTVLERMEKIPHLRPLLVHPVLSSFTYLKWLRIQALFYVNLSLYLIFTILLNAAILFGPHIARPNPAFAFTIIFIFVLILVLALRELFQMFIQRLKYFLNLENWLEVVLLIMSTYVVFNDCSDLSENSLQPFICPQINSICILLSCFGLILLIGKHPRFAVNIEMFKTVSKNFCKFLSWYALLIIAFALSFFVLFRGCYKANQCSNPFENPGNSLFKTIIMLTGEFDADSIPFAVFVGTSHIIFVAFVFFIAIVLLNLLNGLAVSDTQAIKDDMELHTSIARLRFIGLIENILIDALEKKPMMMCLKKLFSRAFLLSSDSSLNHTITVSKRNYEVHIQSISYFMDSDIVHRAIRPSPVDIGRKLKNIETGWEKIQQKLEAIENRISALNR